jgi:chitinase
MRAYLSEDQLLTACLPANQAVLQCIDLGQAALYLDFLNLTAYDFFGAWTPRTGHQAQLYTTSKDETSAAGGVAFLMKAGVPGKKILLGIPVFGRSFLHAAGPGQKYKGVGGHDGSFEYKDLPRRGTKEQIDKRAVAAQCVGADGGFVTYDNPDTVKMKAAFCKQKGLGVSIPLFLVFGEEDKQADRYTPKGLFYWCAPMDSRDSKRSLIASGFRALHSS